jgi:hypothetical protein
VPSNYIQCIQKPSIQTFAIKPPTMAFGKAKWATYFGDIGVEPSLPSNIEQILNGPCPIWADKKVHETHTLTLIPQTVKGNPLNLRLLGDLVCESHLGDLLIYSVGNCLGEYNDPSTTASHWALMSRDVIPNSRYKSYADHQKLVQNYVGYGYQVPTVLDAAVSILMECVSTGTRLYSANPYTYTRCQEKWNRDWQLVVGGFSLSGLSVDCDSYDPQYYGVGALRILQQTTSLCF